MNATQRGRAGRKTCKIIAVSPVSPDDCRCLTDVSIEVIFKYDREAAVREDKDNVLKELRHLGCW